MKVKVLHNQTVFDIAVRYCGTALAAFDIAVLNNISVTSSLITGSMISIPETDYGFSEVVNYFNRKNFQPATKWNPETTVIQPKPEGISHWVINQDFKVTPILPEQIETP